MQQTQGSNEIDWTPITTGSETKLGAGGSALPTSLFGFTKDGKGATNASNGLLSSSSLWSAPAAEPLSAWESVDSGNFSRLFAKDAGGRAQAGLDSGSSTEDRGDYQFAVEPSIAADISAMLSEDFPASSLPDMRAGGPAVEPQLAEPEQDELARLLSGNIGASTGKLSASTAGMTQKRRRDEEEPLFPTAKKARQAETPPGFVSMASLGSRALGSRALQEPDNTVPASQFLVRSSQGASKLLSESSSDLIKQFIEDCSSGELRLLMGEVGGKSGDNNTAAAVGNSFSSVLNLLNSKKSAAAGVQTTTVPQPGLLPEFSSDGVTTGVCVRMFHRSKGNHKWEETNTAPPKIGKMRKLTVTISNPAKPMRVLCKVADISTGEHKSSCKLSTRSSCKADGLFNELELSVPRSPEPITVLCFLKPTWGAKTTHVPRFSVQLFLVGKTSSAPIHSFDIAVASHKYESNTGRKFAGPAPVSSVVLVS